LLAAHERAARLNARVRQLERRLSELLGEQTWQQSGLGAPADNDVLNHKITQLEQQSADLRIQLSERDDELAAARAANRELMTTSTTHQNPVTPANVVAQHLLQTLLSLTTAFELRKRGDQV
jgi:uncharacterized protein YgiM (DUF1202 family)